MRQPAPCGVAGVRRQWSCVSGCLAGFGRRRQRARWRAGHDRHRERYTTVIKSYRTTEAYLHVADEARRSAANKAAERPALALVAGESPKQRSHTPKKGRPF